MGLPEDGDEDRDEDGEETKLSPFNKLAELLWSCRQERDKWQA